MDRDYEEILQAAEEHFRKNGDKVRESSGNEAQACYNVQRGVLFHYARGRLDGNEMDAEDATQEAYVKTLETIHSGPLMNFGAIYKIWLDRSIAMIKIAEARKGAVISPDEPIGEGSNAVSQIDLAEADDPSIEFLIQTQETVDMIMEVTNRMKPKAKGIIRLALVFGYSYQEVAEMMNVSVKRVDNTIAYFKKVNEL